MEWHTPRVRGISPSKTSVIQICSNHDFCAVFRMDCFEQMPASLVDFLCDVDISKVDIFLYGAQIYACGDEPVVVAELRRPANRL